MATTYQTARKSTGGRVFARRTPVELAPAPAPPSPAPAQSEEEDEEWRVSVVITIQDPRYDTRREVHANHDHMPRRSLEVGISEAARRALSRICHIYSDELAASKFRFFPCRSRGAASAQIPRPPPEERDPTMDATQEMVAALSTDLDAAGVELGEVKDELRKLRRQYQILEARQQGE